VDSSHFPLVKDSSILNMVFFSSWGILSNTWYASLKKLTAG
jgi:hypothetical protein